MEAVIAATILVAFWFTLNQFMDKLSETYKSRKK